jgi:hypothetical protein
MPQGEPVTGIPVFRNQPAVADWVLLYVIMPSAIPQELWNEMKKFADRLLTRGKEHDTAKSKKRQAKECGKIGIVAWSADRLEGNDHPLPFPDPQKI